MKRTRGGSRLRLPRSGESWPCDKLLPTGHVQTHAAADMRKDDGNSGGNKF